MPLTVFAIVLSFFLSTCTSINTLFGNLFVDTSIFVVPYFCPVTSPASVTVAMFSSNVLYVISSFSTWSINRLNPKSVFASICLLRLFVSKFNTIFLVFTSRLASEMFAGSVVLVVVLFPIAPYPLYPTVYTKPESSTIAAVWLDIFCVLAIVIMFLSSCTFVNDVSVFVS